jgi:ABC-type polysaccharide/polyol phosphate transport system ATPase subunit
MRILRRRPITSTGQHAVLKDVSIQIRAGDRVGILGVNGVGKSTLCRCLTGIYEADRGTVTRQGRVRGVFDTGIGVFPELTGRENARLLMTYLYPEHFEQHAELMREALDFSELGDFLDSPFRIYSNGMQARLCLSLISCLPSDVLVLDEVFDGADGYFKEKIAARLLSIIEQSGAVVFVSHSIDQLRKICNRGLVFRDGRVALDSDINTAIEAYNHLSRERERLP